VFKGEMVGKKDAAALTPESSADDQRKPPARRAPMRNPADRAGEPRSAATKPQDDGQAKAPVKRVRKTEVEPAAKEAKE